MQPENRNESVNAMRILAIAFLIGVGLILLVLRFADQIYGIIK